MTDFFDTPISAYDDYLEHHGIKGQKWGVRNAEWYPIEAYRKAKGIVVEAANSNTAKAVKSGAKKTAEETVKVSKKAAAKASEIHEKNKAKKQARKEAAEVKRQAKEVKRQEDFEKEKNRILNSGSPAEVLKISDRLTNDELNYARNRNQLLSDMRNLNNKHVSDMKDSEFRKKWGGLVNAGEGLKRLSEPIDNVATALQRYKKFTDAFNGLSKEDKISNIDDIKRNPTKYSDKDIKDARERQQNIDLLNKGIKGQKGTIGSMPGNSNSWAFSPSEKKELLNSARKNDSWSIDFLEVVQNDPVLKKGGKDLISEYTKYLDNPNKYRSTFKESAYKKKYKNSPEVREAMRIAKSDGWDSLTKHQKELLNELG